MDPAHRILNNSFDYSAGIHKHNDHILDVLMSMYVGLKQKGFELVRQGRTDP